MNQITRTPESSTPRADTPAAPRGDELQQASSRFAELLAKENKEARTKSDRDRGPKTVDDHADGATRFEDRADASCGLPYGIYLPGERGQGSSQKDTTRHGTAADADLMENDPKETDFSGLFLGPPISTTSPSPAPPIDAPSAKYLGPPLRVTDPSPVEFLGPPPQANDPTPVRFLGPPLRPADEDHRSARRQASDSDAAAAAAPLPTPGDLLLQAFSKPAPAAVELPARLGPPLALDAVRQLGEQIAERILISATEAGGAKEMMIQLKDSVLPGTEVRMVRDGERLQVTLVTDHATSFHLLAAQQSDLQARLGDRVVVNLSFDPEGMISRQRLDAPTAAETGQQAGDDRRRDADDQRRDRRRNQQQDSDA